MQLEAEGIGIKCRNSLIALPEFGTRIVLLTFAVREIPPETLSRIADCPSLVEHSAKRMRQLLPLHESVPHRCNIRKRIDDRTLYAAANGNRAASGQRSRHAENFYRM